MPKNYDESIRLYEEKAMSEKEHAADIKRKQEQAIFNEELESYRVRNAAINNSRKRQAFSNNALFYTTKNYIKQIVIESYAKLGLDKEAKALKEDINAYADRVITKMLMEEAGIPEEKVEEEEEEEETLNSEDIVEEKVEEPAIPDQEFMSTSPITIDIDPTAKDGIVTIIKVKMPEFANRAAVTMQTNGDTDGDTDLSNELTDSEVDELVNNMSQEEQGEVLSMLNQLPPEEIDGVTDAIVQQTEVAPIQSYADEVANEVTDIAASDAEELQSLENSIASIGSNTQQAAPTLDTINQKLDIISQALLTQMEQPNQQEDKYEIDPNTGTPVKSKYLQQVVQESKKEEYIKEYVPKTILEKFALLENKKQRLLQEGVVNTDLSIIRGLVDIVILESYSRVIGGKAITREELKKINVF